MSFLGDSIVKYAKKQDINLELKSSSNLRLLQLSSATNQFEYDLKISDSKISGHGENLIFGIFNNEIAIENLLLEIHLEEKDDVVNIVKNAVQKLTDKNYSISITSLVIHVYNKKSSNEEFLIDEILINNIKLSKDLTSQNYSCEVGINKDKKASFFFTINNNSINNYEMISKFENDNFSCSIYDTNSGGTINCLSKNTLLFLKDLGSNVENRFFQTLLNKRLSVKANIKHDGENKIIDGSFVINNDVGKITFNTKDRVVNLSLDKLDLDKTADEIKDLFNDDEQEEEQKKIMIMSGKENKIIAQTKKKETLENVNSLNKIFLYLFELSKTLEFGMNISIKESISNGNISKNTIIKTLKKNDGTTEIKEISMDFGVNQTDRVLIKNNASSEGNILVEGEKLNNLANLLNIQEFNRKNEQPYRITGDIKLSLNTLNLNNITFESNGKKFITYNFEHKYDFRSKNFEKNKQIYIQNININDYLDTVFVYKGIYTQLKGFQDTGKQDAIFWKMLFEKRHRDFNIKNTKFTFVINNSMSSGKKIENFVINYEDTKKQTIFNIISKGEMFDGSFDFNLQNINNKEYITSSLIARNINFTDCDIALNEIKQASGMEFTKIFTQDKDYNVPSFIGLNGVFNLSIDNLYLKDKVFNDIKGKILMSDGILNTEYLNFLFKNGKIDINSAISLQGRPEFQIAFAASGLNIDELLNSPLDGYASFQCSFKSFGFNPVKMMRNLNGNGKIIIQNLKIPNFDLLNMSKDVMINGVRRGVNYKNVISKNPLFFAKSEGNLLLENGILKADIVSSRELVSLSAEFEYDIFTHLVNKLSGSFATMMVRKPLEKPFAIYIPFACSGHPETAECMIDWKQLDETILQYTN